MKITILEALEAWKDVFVATAEASAALAGPVRPQALAWFGVEVIAFAVVTWLISLYQVSVLPFVAGGVILALDDPNGMYWVVFGIITAIVISMLTTWVLLIEILR